MFSNLIAIFKPSSDADLAALKLLLSRNDFICETTRNDFLVHFQQSRKVLAELKGTPLGDLVDINHPGRVTIRCGAEVNSVFNTTIYSKDISSVLGQLCKITHSPTMQEALPKPWEVKCFLASSPFSSEVVETQKYIHSLPVKDFQNTLSSFESTDSQLYGESLEVFTNFFDSWTYKYVDVLLELIKIFGESLVYLATEHRTALIIGMNLFFRYAYRHFFAAAGNFTGFLQNAHQLLTQKLMVLTKPLRGLPVKIVEGLMVPEATKHIFRYVKLFGIPLLGLGLSLLGSIYLGPLATPMAVVAEKPWVFDFVFVQVSQNLNHYGGLAVRLILSFGKTVIQELAHMDTSPGSIVPSKIARAILKEAVAEGISAIKRE